MCSYTAASAAAAAVRHRVPEGVLCRWFIESDSINSVFFLFIQSQFIFNVPLGSTIAFTASICLYVMTGMRGAKAAVSPPRRLYIYSEYYL